MLPTEEQAAALEATLHACNGAASWLSTVMHADRVRGKYDAQKRFYTTLKQHFGLSAQPAIRVIGKVADAYATLRANIDAGNYGPAGSEKRKTVTATPIGFRADAAQPFDARCLSWQLPEEVGGREATVSIWTTAGRLKGVRILAAPRDLVLLRTRAIGETDLIGRGYGFVRPNGPRCIPGRSPNSAAFWPTSRRPLGWRSSRSTPPTRRRRAARVAGWTNATAAPRVALSVAGVASLGTPTTMQRSSSQPAVSSAGVKSCAHTQRPP